uniref:18 kDa Sin3-associated polypeptide n=1 Tax=Monodelphis domestica TaxID=13616 RepID=A0A5F8GPG6_MONDO
TLVEKTTTHTKIKSECEKIIKIKQYNIIIKTIKPLPHKLWALSYISSMGKIYIWIDATLKELTGLIQTKKFKRRVHTSILLLFSQIFKKKPGYCVKKTGSTISGKKGTDYSMTLQPQKFQVGDYLDIAITPPNQAPHPSGCMRSY